MWRLAALLVALPLAVGCTERQPADEEPAAASEGVAEGGPLDSENAAKEELTAVQRAAASSLASELLRLPGGVTLADWLADREAASIVTPIGRHRDGTPLVCATGVDEDTVGRMIRRSTLFFHPPPVGSAVPTATVDRASGAVRIAALDAMVRQGCRVAAVEAELAGIDSAGTAALARAVWQELSDALGAPADSGAVNSRLAPPGTGRRWLADSLSYVVTAFAPDGVRPGRVWGRAELPSPPFTPPDFDSLHVGGTAAERRRLVEEQAAASARSAAPLLDLLAEFEAGTIDEARAVGVLRAWLEGAAQLDSLARAGAYLAADVVLALAADFHAGLGGRRASWSEDSVGWAYLDSLEALGADFRYHEIHGMRFNRRGWLNRAAELDPAGPVGRLARVARLESDHHWYMKCPYRQERTIAAAEAQLPDAREPEVRARLHYLLASMHRDYVLFADHQREVVATLQAHLYGTDDDEFLDGYAHRPEAVENYLTAAALAESRRLRQAAWWNAWYVAIGYRLEEPVLFCLSD